MLLHVLIAVCSIRPALGHRRAYRVHTSLLKIAWLLSSASGCPHAWHTHMAARNALCMLPALLSLLPALLIVPPSVKIVTGSLQGHLRVYLPHGREPRPEDLLLEQELEGGAVLSLAAGRFVGP